MAGYKKGCKEKSMKLEKYDEVKEFNKILKLLVESKGQEGFDAIFKPELNGKAKVADLINNMKKIL